jgi:hypothetical protein
MHHCVNLKSFTRRTSEADDPRLILEAPNAVARRELLLAAKKTGQSLKVLLHLNPQSRANKSLLYYKTKRNHLRIEDRGDLVIIYVQQNTIQNVKIDVNTSAQAVTDKMDVFLGELEMTRQQTIRQYTPNNTTRSPTSHQPAGNPHPKRNNQHNRRVHWSTHAPTQQLQPAQQQIQPPQTIRHAQQPHMQTAATTHQPTWYQPAPPASPTPPPPYSTLHRLLEQILA